MWFYLYLSLNSTSNRLVNRETCAFEKVLAEETLQLSIQLDLYVDFSRQVQFPCDNMALEIASSEIYILEIINSFTLKRSASENNNQDFNSIGLSAFLASYFPSLFNRCSSPIRFLSTAMTMCVCVLKDISLNRNKKLSYPPKLLCLLPANGSKIRFPQRSRVNSILFRAFP